VGGQRYEMRGVLFEGIDFSEGWFDDAMLAFSVFRNCTLDLTSFTNASEVLSEPPMVGRQRGELAELTR
jgi:hypothetical protein